MRLTKDNINEYIDKDGNLDLCDNKEITNIDYIPDNVKYISISSSNIVEITCKLPEGLKGFFCHNSKISKLPLLPKSLYNFSGEDTNLPKEFQVNILFDNIQCNNLRKLQMINSI